MHLPRSGGMPRHVGVRRCLTRPARRAGRPSRRRSSGVPLQSLRAGECRGLPRHAARAGEAAPRPYIGVVHHRAGVCQPHIGGARTPGCRGQALPDPSGPLGPAERRQRARWCGDDHGGGGGQRCIAAPMARAGEAAPRPYNVARCIPGRADGHHGWRRPPSCRGQAVPDPSGPGGPADRCQRVRWCGDDHGGGGGPRCIAAPSGAGGRGAASPLQRGRSSPCRRVPTTHWRCATLVL
jgi:hypothetical protein